MMSRRYALLGTAIVLAALAVAGACGGSDGGDSPEADAMSPEMENSGTAAGPEVTIDLKAEKLRFVPDMISVPAGKTVMIRFENLDAGVEHDFEVDGLNVTLLSGGMATDGHGGESTGPLAAHTQSGETATVMFRTDQTGTFDIYCTIAGHREAGMEGKVTVS